MTDKILHQHFYIALAFQTMVVAGQDLHSTQVSKRIIELAKQISDYCHLYAPLISDLPSVRLVNEVGAEEIDTIIDGLINLRRENKAIEFQQDHETLLKLYDRLQLRAARRVNRLLFATITEAQLHKYIRGQINEEIEERGLQS